MTPPAYELRPIGSDEVRAFVTATAESFQEDPHAEDVEAWSAMCEPARTFAVFDGTEIVGTSGLVSRELTVPGAIVPMAGVTAVGVHSTHRRRGLLDRMMRAHLEAIHAGGTEAVSALWASEGGIYGRFGFGLATRGAEIEVRSPEAHLREPAPPERPRPIGLAEAPAAFAPVYEALRPAQPGFLGRGNKEWKHGLRDAEHRRNGAGRLRAVIQDGPGGDPAGYAVFAVRKQYDGRPQDVVELRELLATTPAAAAALWEHLLRMSLARSVHWPLGPEDDALPHMLTDPRAVAMRVGDTLWIRLVDVPRALAERTYTTALDVVLDVADPVCPWNEGRWRLAGDPTGATCERTDAPADLSLSATELGAAHLGGTSLALLATAGRMREHTAGALAAASGAFTGPRAPWCPEVF